MGISGAVLFLFGSCVVTSSLAAVQQPSKDDNSLTDRTHGNLIKRVHMFSTRQRDVSEKKKTRKSEKPLLIEDLMKDQKLACVANTSDLFPAPDPREGDRVIGGHTAVYGSHPWQVGMWKKSTGDRYVRHCGGAIIDEYWFVTGAHCIDEKATYKVVVGDHDYEKADEGEKTFLVEKTFVHETYSTFDYDFALVRVMPVDGRGFQFNTYVSPVCLPNVNQKYTPGQRCYISGMGANTYFDDGKNTKVTYPKHQQEAVVPLMDDASCQKILKQGKYPMKLTSRMTCAGDLRGGIDACGGDSGGPLVCENKGIVMLIGLSSWGRGCALKGEPGVYSKVTYFLPWILEKIKAYKKP